MLQEMEISACVQALVPRASITAAPRQLRVSGLTGSSVFCSVPEVPGSVPSRSPDGGCLVSPSYTRAGARGPARALQG